MELSRVILPWSRIKFKSVAHSHVFSNGGVPTQSRLCGSFMNPHEYWTEEEEDACCSMWPQTTEAHEREVVSGNANNCISFPTAARCRTPPPSQYGERHRLLLHFISHWYQWHQSADCIQISGPFQYHRWIHLNTHTHTHQWWPPSHLSDVRTGGSRLYLTTGFAYSITNIHSYLILIIITVRLCFFTEGVTGCLRVFYDVAFFFKVASNQSFQSYICILFYLVT